MLKTCTLAAAILIAPAAWAQSCPDIAGAVKVESERYVVAYRTRPAKIVIGQHFTMDLAVCPRVGQSAAEHVRVDAYMPEHKHGMNYKVTVQPGDGGRYRAEGFMFHMPGRWELIFEVRGKGRTDRVKRSVMLD